MPKQSGAKTGASNTGSITFVHTSDWQLGKPFAGIADPAKRARVQQERFEVIRRIGAVVRDRQARFVVVAGDIFDSPTPARATISAALGAIAELGVPVYAIPGNHDHAGPDSVWENAFYLRERERVAPNFHLLVTPTATVVDLSDREKGPGGDVSGDIQRVALLSCPLLRRHQATDPTAWIRSFDFSAVGEIPRIAIAHGSTTVFASSGQRDDDGEVVGPANTIALDRLPIEQEIDFIALGDWHGFSPVGFKAWYSGTPETDRFPKAGQEPGHVACVIVSRGGPPLVETIRTGRFRWLTHTIALDAVAESEFGTPAVASGDGGASAGANTGIATGVATSVATDGVPESRGPAYLDAWLTQATHPTAEGEPGFDGSLARITVTGTVSLAGRQELDRIIESWDARLLRLDFADAVQITPTADEIHDLAERPGDPIISRVAEELVQQLEAGGPQAEIDVIRQAIFMLHALAHPESSHRCDHSQRPVPKASRQSETTSSLPAGATN
jgi:hypothetical protein